MKEIKDYVHLYLGSEIIGVGNSGIPNDVFKYEINLSTLLLYTSGKLAGNYKLLLRPLSDMTEEEAKTLLKIRYWRPGQEPIYQRHSSICIDFKFYYSENRYSETQLDWDMLDAESVRWLLSKHFDLFGLIESGLAIDKTLVAA